MGDDGLDRQTLRMASPRAACSPEHVVLGDRGRKVGDDQQRTVGPLAELLRLQV